MTRYQSPVAVMVMLARTTAQGTEILLQLRQNTGYMDNHWDFSATGHVEAHESLTQAAVRETREELGIVLDPASLTFAHHAYVYTDEASTYANTYFWAQSNQTPTIQEPHKCAALAWFPLNALPSTLIPQRRGVLEAIASETFFSETGFSQEAQ